MMRDSTDVLESFRFEPFHPTGKSSLSDICCSCAPLNKWVIPLRFVPQARKNELAVEDMDGGTFTISNGGVFGSMFGTPIINPPQSAILGMHGIFDRPVAVNGKVRIVLTDEIQSSSFFKL